MNRLFRIAPTPSGYLHEGNAFNFLLTAARARATAGSLRLRIDDLDAPRVRPEYLADVFETLDWLGIRPDTGPQTPADHTGRFAQALRLPAYEAMLAGLAAAGTVFACTCSRAAVLARSPDGRYPGTCLFKNIPLDAPDVTWRVATPDAQARVMVADRWAGTVTIDLAVALPHFVVRRRDGLPAYHVASLADDLAYGITDIVRGEDLLLSTAAQCYLSRLLGGTAFDAVLFEHHTLLREAGGEKRSKSAGAVSLRAARERGEPAQALYSRFSAWMGWPEPVFSVEEAAVRLCEGEVG